MKAEQREERTDTTGPGAQGAHLRSIRWRLDWLILLAVVTLVVLAVDALHHW